MRLFLLFTFIISINAFGKSNFQKQVDVIERTILDEIQKQTKGKISEERKFYLYVLAAREYMQISYKEKAIEYLEKAYHANVSINKFEVIVNLMALNWGDKNEMRKYYQDLEIEGRKSKEARKFEPYVKGMKAYIYGKALEKDHPWNKGVYNYMFLEQNFQNLMAQKKFKEALAQMNPKGMDEAGPDSKATYELLKTLVFKTNYKPVHCEGMIKEYPKASGYTANLCRSVLAYHKKDKALLKQSIEQTKKALEGKNYNKDHLLTALSELKL